MCVNPELARLQRCSMPLEKKCVKAEYLPRSPRGTVWSEMEKSRICNSYNVMSVGLVSVGLGVSFQKAGFASGESKSTRKLFKESADSPNEKGSVTTFVTTLPSSRENTF